ncbi:hypothetical protein BG015_006991 [Linnemannia schmuckeri]|uniref:Plastocyanin-like domain-containing protein n=1 Tax=Linnemannia schmuckeri TaxID=64567 RepID=A0A9P5S1Q6_9FUNG|nr:hypothetical protein BG015_006991 [Linnemannia schmuckeri]
MATTSADNQISLTASFHVMDDYINKTTFNDITYVAPKVPTLYTAVSIGNLSSGPQICGTYAHPLVLKHNSWVEIIINNNDAGNHPFHLHGHVFQVVGREWHLQAGLANTIIEAPEVMSGVLTVDQTHLQHCTDLGLPFSGNAARNQGFDLTGQNVGSNLLSGTFTTKGIIALLFTVLSAVVGLATVVWYAQDEELVSSKEGKDGKD